MVESHIIFEKYELFGQYSNCSQEPLQEDRKRFVGGLGLVCK